MFASKKLGIKLFKNLAFLLKEGLFLLPLSISSERKADGKISPSSGLLIISYTQGGT